MRLVLCLVATFVAAPLLAQPLVFDSDFGTNGVVEIVPDTPTGAYALTALAGGDVILGASVKNDGALVRLDASGGLVSSFGDAGIARFRRDATAEHYPVDVVEAAGGDFLVAGTTVSGSVSRGFVSRLSSDGDLDTSFGTDGFVTISSDNGYARAEIVALGLLDGGGLVAVGSGRTTSNAAAMPIVARMTADGALDTTYGSNSDGIARINLSMTVINGLILPSGQVYISGSAPTGEAILLRLTASGDLDPSFGNAGVVKFDPSDVRDYFYRLALDSQGRIVAAVTATAADEVPAQGYVARYLPNGTLDPSFDGDGYAQATGDGGASAVLIRGDGSILVIGSTAVGDGYQALVAQFTQSGALDTTFGTGGRITIDADRDNTGLEGVADGSDVVVAGYFTGADYTRNGILAFRLTPMGTATEPGLLATGLSLRHGGAHPARGAVRLAVTVDRPTALRVDLVDLQGRVVAHVQDGVLGEGDHALPLTVDVPAGMYLARAIADDGRRAHLPVVVLR